MTKTATKARHVPPNGGTSQKTKDDRDHDALERCIQATLASKDHKRAEQVREKLAEEPWNEVALFCVYDRQLEALHLKPWEDPPCWIEPDDIKAILATPGHASFEAAKLAKQLIDAGLSIYEPDPIEALKRKRK
jgi:hypothetical protein